MSANDVIPTNNGAVLNISQIIQAVMSSAAEAELGALFINAKTAVSMSHTLKELGHPQQITPIQTDNKTANDLLTNKIMSKALKAIDMQSTGCAAATLRDNLDIIGDWAHKT